MSTVGWFNRDYTDTDCHLSIRKSYYVMRYLNTVNLLTKQKFHKSKVKKLNFSPFITRFSSILHPSPVLKNRIQNRDRTQTGKPGLRDRSLGNGS